MSTLIVEIHPDLTAQQLYAVIVALRAGVPASSAMQFHCNVPKLPAPVPVDPKGVADGAD